MRIWLFNQVSARVLGHSSFCTNRNTLGALERLLKDARVLGSSSFFLIVFPASSIEVLSLLGWRVC